MMPQTPRDRSDSSFLSEEVESTEPDGILLPPPVTRDEARDAINELFRRAMKHGDPQRWMRGLLTFIAGMRRYSVFNAKLIYIQRPGAVAVGTERYWAKRGRSIRPGAVPIVIFAPKGPFALVYEYEDTEGAGRQNPHGLFTATGQVSDRDWSRLKAAVERDGRKSGEEHGLFHILEYGLGHARAGDVHFRRDAQGRFVIRINHNLGPSAKWTTLVHELGHVYCGHIGNHPQRWWPDRRDLAELHPQMRDDIREFEAEAVAWIVASRAGIETRSADYLATRATRRDNERVDIDAVLHAANHIESIAPTADVRTFRANDEF